MGMMLLCNEQMAKTRFKVALPLQKYEKNSLLEKNIT
jgi:hypothetical protein